MNRRPKGWPSPVWWATLGAGVLGVLFMVLGVWLDCARDWSILEKFYLKIYAKTWLVDVNPLPHRAKARYRLIDAVNKKGEQRLVAHPFFLLSVPHNTEGAPSFAEKRGVGFCASQQKVGLRGCRHLEH